MRRTLLWVFLLLLSFPAMAQVHLGQVEDLSFFSKSLNQQSRVRVYLPPGYLPANHTREYPVVFFLHGASSSYEAYSSLLPLLDAMWLQASIDPFILVMPDGQTPPFNGSFYTNSTLYGNYEDVISTDLVPLVDSLYNTLNSRNFRAIMGHSMGAYGAFKQAFKHPDLYTAVAGHSGPLNIEMLDILIPDIKAENGSPPYHWRHAPGKGRTNLIFTMAGAFSPNAASANQVDFPLDEQGELIDSVLARWNPHNIAEMARWYLPLTDLSIYFDCGTQDQYHLHFQNRSLSDTLQLFGIRHIYTEYFGDHVSGLPFRIPIALRFIDQVFKGHLTEIQQVALTEKKVVRIFPNPTTGRLYFEPEDPEDLQAIRIFTNSGQLVRELPPNANPVELTNLPQGVYQVLFYYPQTTAAFPVLKIR